MNNNMYLRLFKKAQEIPQSVAVVYPQSYRKRAFNYRQLTFEELLQKTNNISNSLIEMGGEYNLRGKKALLLVPPGLSFCPLVFALFKIGVIPVFIDPGMGKRYLLKSIEQIAPDILIGPPKVHFISLFYKMAFRSVRFFITTGKIGRLKRHSLLDFENKMSIINDECLFCDNNRPAAILFTSGGTGSPKGVLYTHGIFNAQTNSLQKLFNLNSGQIDLAGFPIFSLFTIVMGMTSVIPAMNPSCPALADPKKLYQNIIDNKASFVAGSPAIWENLANYCLEYKLKLPSVKALVMFGAPVSLKLHRQFQVLLPHGTTYTPYGATECLPVSMTSGKVILEGPALQMEKGAGTYLGKRIEGVDIAIIKNTPEVIERIDPSLFLQSGEVGEIVVCSKMVTLEYVGLPSATALAKMKDEQGRLWHRMGDLGYLDDVGDLWFLGRKTHCFHSRGKFFSSIQCESIFNVNNKVKRTALIHIYKDGEKDFPALVIEREKSQKLNKKQMEDELKDMALKHSHTQEIEKFFYCSRFPVDARHNIKIDRLNLKEQVMREQGF